MVSLDKTRELVAYVQNLMVNNGIRHYDMLDVDYYAAYGDNLYDWEHYFDSIALSYFNAEIYAINGLKMCLHNQREDGFICRHIKGTGDGVVGSADKTDFSDELVAVGAMWEEMEKEEHFKPFLCQFVLMVSRMRGDVTWLKLEEFKKLRRYVDHWLFACDRNANGLSVWCSSSHSGADTQHERMGAWKSWFCEGVDLNCYLYRECLAAARIAEAMNLTDDAAHFLEHAERKKRKMQELMWDEKDGFFYDRNEKTGEFIKVKTAATFVTLWAGIATKEQAENMVQRHLKNPKEFWTPYPVCTFSQSEPGYTQFFKPPGSDYVQGLIPDHGNWNGGTWPHWNYIFIHGLEAYGYHKEARQVAEKFFEATSEPDGPYEWHNAETGQGRGMYHPFWAGAGVLGAIAKTELDMGFDPTKIESVDVKLDFSEIRRVLGIDNPFDTKLMDTAAGCETETNMH